jgi:DNA-binding NarL/FixJ family response regulator
MISPMNRPSIRRPLEITDAAVPRSVIQLEQGRGAYSDRIWGDAYTWLASADGSAGLGGDDLELLATAAYLIGRENDFLSALERAHRSYVDAGRVARAARCAFWLGFRLAFRGEMGLATGWLGRARRLLERESAECVEHGYLLLPAVEQQLAVGEYEQALSGAAAAAKVAERHGDVDLLTYAVHLQGRAVLKQARIAEGLALLDEAMVTVASQEIFPPLAGVIYCSVIEACRSVFALQRAREWTDALADWCARQPDMVAFTGQCLVYRAELLQIHGEWDEALGAAERARERCSATADWSAAASAYFWEGEIHRLRGDLDAAREAYLAAAQAGWEPQPGLALLGLAQGRIDDAVGSIRRACLEASDPSRRARLLPAFVEIMLAVKDLSEARRGCLELEALAVTYSPSVLSSMAAHVRGAIALAEGEPAAALVALRRASAGWHELGAPYELARARVLVGVACRALADEEAAELELEAARSAFQALGAAPDLLRVTSLLDDHRERRVHGLSPRELELVRLLARGSSNKAIAAELLIAEKTVERHLTNIFRKLGVPSRTAAAAYAFEHQLV